MHFCAYICFCFSLIHTVTHTVSKDKINWTEAIAILLKQWTQRYSWLWNILKQMYIDSSNLHFSENKIWQLSHSQHMGQTNIYYQYHQMNEVKT